MHNIFIIANYAPKFGGNFAESLVALQDEISRRGGEAYFAFPKAASGQWWTCRFKHVDYFEMTKKAMYSLFERVINDYRCDIVHAHFFGRRGGVYIVKGIQRRIPIIWHFHNHVSSRKGFGRMLDKAIYRYIYGSGSAIGVSKSVSNSVKSATSLNCITIYNGLQTDRLDQHGEQTAIPVESNCISCLIMANHYQRKGVDLAAEAIQELNDRGLSSVLYACCDNGNEVIEWVKRVLNARDCDFNKDNLIPVPTTDDIAAYYSVIDVFLFPSREEGFTWAVDEAAYCGAPVVLTRCPGQDENRVPGFQWIDNPSSVSNKETVSQLVNAIIAATTACPSEIEERRSEAKRYVREHFSISSWAQKICDAYEVTLRKYTQFQ